MRCQPCGPLDAAVFIVGEAPGVEEEKAGVPFVGTSGWELTRMLKDAGIDREACYITNVVKERPAGNDIKIWITNKKTVKPGEVKWGGLVVRDFILDEIRQVEEEIRRVKPKVIIVLGNTALWALTGQQSVDKWRGSHMRLREDIGHDCYVIPTYHPAAILRMYSWRFIAVNDLRTAKRLAYEPLRNPPMDDWECIIRPTYRQVYSYLSDVWDLLNEDIQLELICDLEIKESRIVCMGLGYEEKRAICIPFLSNSGFYWTVEEHTAIVAMFIQITQHPNCRLCNQNIAFDIQFMWNDWMLWPKAFFDTMVAQAVLFPGTPARLDYLSSMYCSYYYYWKDDGKFWKEFVEDERLWRYNCYDCIYTYQVQQAQKNALASLKLSNQAREQFRILNHVIAMMHDGVRVDRQLKGDLLRELMELIEQLKWELEYLVGESLWAEKGFSPKRIGDFFYEIMKMPVQLSKTKTPTCDDEALKKFAKLAPWLRPICERINMIRSYGTAINVCLSRVDKDGRWRCSYRVGGTETLRFTSSENPFGSGTNLQNITIGRNILEET